MSSEPLSREPLSREHEPVPRALLVGLNYAGTDDELHGCIRDVNNMHAMLSRSGVECRVVTDATGRVTRNRLRTAIKDFLAIIEPNTLNFFHFSGHGTQREDKNGDESDGLDEALWLSDGVVLDDTLRRWFRSCKGTLMVIVDACHSGSVLDLPYEFTSRADRRKTADVRTVPRPFRGSADVICLSACRDEGEAAGGESGALTDAFCKVWEAHVESKRSELNIVQMHWSVARVLKYTGFPQRPILSVSRTRRYDSYLRGKCWVRTRRYRPNDFKQN